MSTILHGFLCVCVMYVSDRQQADEVTDLLPYIQRLSWLMFVHVSLSLAAMSHKSASNVDADYMHQANVLVSECVSVACSRVTTG
jgi:hypothetical protein